MRDGDYYVADDELSALTRRAVRLLGLYEQAHPSDPDIARYLLSQVLGQVGEDVDIRPPLRVDYGYNITIGDGSWVNFGLTALDVAPIVIGADVLIGPNCSLYTAIHPTEPGPRRAKWESSAPITLEDNVWLGGSVVVCPGVSIGENSIIGAGAVVTPLDSPELRRRRKPRPRHQGTRPERAARHRSRQRWRYKPRGNGGAGMTILPIYITGEPILHRVADPVESFDSTLRDLVADMIETMHAAPGVGLAAPQVGVGLQLFVWSYRGGGAFDRRYKDILGLNDGAARGYNSAMSGVVVNPTLELVWDDDGIGSILPTQPDMTNESEGCLSVPGVQYPLRRALGAILRGYDADGNTVQASARGWLARIFQHEYDHLRGTFYVDRLDMPYREDSRAYVAERGWGSSGCTWTPGERA